VLKGHTPDKSAAIDRGLKRLTATGPKGMGESFKVLAIADPKFGDLPGFEA
jgi:SAM-dependent MidA family methyltransferase